jgi:hypothetical protein
MLVPLPSYGADTRLPTDQERAAFQAFYQQSTQGMSALAPAYKVTREGAAAPWRIEAQVDGKPRRALRTLCRMEREVFVLDGSWRRAPAQQLAWHATAGCVVPATPIVLGQRMPDTDILALISNQSGILTRARLLFAGSTACAPQRAYNYQLAGIDVSTFINGSEEMATLTYRSDRGPTARVWARRTGLSYDPWNVSCP